MATNSFGRPGGVYNPFGGTLNRPGQIFNPYTAGNLNRPGGVYSGALGRPGGAYGGYGRPGGNIYSVGNRPTNAGRTPQTGGPLYSLPLNYNGNNSEGPYNNGFTNQFQTQQINQGNQEGINPGLFSPQGGNKFGGQDQQLFNRSNGLAPFIYKPSSDGRLNPGGVSVIFSGKDTPNYGSVGIYSEDGTLIDELKRGGSEGDSVKYYSRRPGSSYGDNVYVQFTDAQGQVHKYPIERGGQRYEGDLGNPDSLRAVNKPGGGGGGGYGGAGGGPGAAPGGFGFFPAYLGDIYPDPVLINYSPMERAPYDFTDVQKFAEQYGEFNRGETRKNFDLSRDLALKELDTELEGLKSFLPAASALKREQLSIDNTFNQMERDRQVDAALPGVRGELNDQADRFRAFAEGRVPDSITDRALELGIRSAAADNANIGGFGSRSSAARGISDLMSADARINLSKYGDAALSNNINQRRDTFLAPTSYSDAGQQVRVTPEVGAGRLTASNLSEQNAMNNITTQNAFTGTVQQKQFETGLEQQTRMFNTSNQLATDTNNANIQNSFALGKFGYEVGYANAVAGAYQTDMNTQVALAQQAQYASTFQGYQGQAQQSQQAGAVAQGIGAAITQIPSIIQGVSDIISSVSGGSSQPSPTANQGQTGGGFTSASDAGGSSSTPGSVVSSPDSVPSGYTPNQSIPLPNGAPGVVSVPTGVADSQVQSFANDTGLQSTIASDPQQATTRMLLSNGANVLSGAGVYSAPQPGAEQIGYSKQGTPVFVKTSFAKSADQSAGSTFVNTVRDVLDPTGAFSKEDLGSLNQIAAVAGDANLAAQLTAQYQNGDTKGFVNTMLGALGKPLIDNMTEAGQTRDGLNAAFGAYQLFQHWDQMSPTQKSLGIASLGIQGYKFATGENLAEKNIVEATATAPGLNVGQAMNLLSAGVNVYSMIKNWGQMSDVQRVAAGTGTAASMAQLAQQFGMLGAGTQGAAVAGVTAESLASAGWSAAPAFGNGAVVGAAGSQVPAGYTSVATTAEGGTVAIPSSLTSSTGLGTLATGLNVAASTVAIGLGAKTVHDNWGRGGKEGRLAGVVGGSSMAAGLYGLGAANPYLLGGVMAVSIAGTSWQVGKSVDQSARDIVRDHFKKGGLLDQDYNVTLADGTKASLGIDGHGGRHTVTNADLLTKEHKDQKTGGANKLNAWDIDYTNDLDYAAGMAGIGLSRLISGGKSKNIDQLGNQLGNALISNIGYGKDFSPENFKKAQENARAVYAQAGIKDKATAFQLSNQAFAEGRLDETDLITTQQALNMVFDDNGYDTAKQLMAGRHRGLAVASQGSAAVNPPKEDVDGKPVRGGILRTPGREGGILRTPSGKDIDPGRTRNVGELSREIPGPRPGRPGGILPTGRGVASGPEGLKLPGDAGMLQEGYESKPGNRLTKEQLRKVNQARYQGVAA